MQVKNGLVAAAIVGFTIALTHVAAQGPPPPQTPPGGAPQTPTPPGGRGQGRGRAETFPAQQRPPGDPAVIKRGKTLYDISCSGCHGIDLRGGQLGGSNLLRSQIVLSDQAGESILPIVRGSLADRGMPAMPLPEDEVKAIAEYMHSVLATAPRQGAPPPSMAPPPDVLVGDASAGQAYFARKCSACHSATADLQGIATRIADAKTLQNFWVSGGGAGRGGRGGGGGRGGSSARAVTVTVTLPSREKVEGRLLRVDDFIVSLTQADGTVRSFSRIGARPKVEIRDPLEPHRALLAVYTDKDMHDVTAYLVTLK